MSGWQLLAAKPRFRRLVASSGLWYATRAYELVVLSWLVLELTDSVAAVTALGAARGLPMLLLGYAGGALADRVSRLRLLRTTQSICLAVVAAYAVYLAFGSPAAWSAHLVIGVIGAVWSVDFANRRSLYTDLFEQAELATAVPVDTTTFTIGLIVGPLAAGVLTRMGGFAVAYAGLAAIHAASVALLPGDRRRPAPPVRRDGRPVRRAERPAAAGRVRAALATLRGRRALQAAVLVTLVGNFFAFPFHQMVPVIGRDVLSADALRFGILVSAWGVGALGGSLALAARAARRPGWVFAAGMATLFACIGGFALSGAYLLSVGLLLAGGVGFSGFAAMQILITLRTAPPALRGRSLGVVSLAIGMQPLGAVALGFTAERIGPQAALAGFALLGLCGLALVRWRYPELGRRATLSERPEPRQPPG